MKRKSINYKPLVRIVDHEIKKFLKKQGIENPSFATTEESGMNTFWESDECVYLEDEGVFLSKYKLVCHMPESKRLNIEIRESFDNGIDESKAILLSLECYCKLAKTLKAEIHRALMQFKKKYLKSPKESKKEKQ